MTEAEFEMMTPARFFLALRFFNDQETARVRSTTEVARMQTTIIVNLFAKNKVSPEQLWPLPWDQENKKQENNTLLEPGEMAKIAEKLWQKG